MKYETIKIDTAFPGFRDKQLEARLEEGWIIHDKTVTGDRYIYYVICFSPEKQDLRKQSDTPN